MCVDSQFSSLMPTSPTLLHLVAVENISQNVTIQCVFTFHACKWKHQMEPKM